MTTEFNPVAWSNWATNGIRNLVKWVGIAAFFTFLAGPGSLLTFVLLTTETSLLKPEGSDRSVSFIDKVIDWSDKAVRGARPGTALANDCDANVLDSDVPLVKGPDDNRATRLCTERTVSLAWVKQQVKHSLGIAYAMSVAISGAIALAYLIYRVLTAARRKR